ncbi:hypothetical protein GJ496_008594 [Pomphorhynchus laevis]|nr:hypothetical protein GJ496_008594 [Pomphorhynchus laevis]
MLLFTLIDYISCSPSRRRDTASGGGNLLNKSALKRLNDLAEKCISSTDSWNLDSLQRFKSRILSIVSRRHICNDPTDSILQAVANVANEFCEEVSSPVSGCAILDQ